MVESLLLVNGCACCTCGVSCTTLLKLSKEEDSDLALFLVTHPLSELCVWLLSWDGAVRGLCWSRVRVACMSACCHWRLSKGFLYGGLVPRLDRFFGSGLTGLLMDQGVGVMSLSGALDVGRPATFESR